MRVWYRAGRFGGDPAPKPRARSGLGQYRSGMARAFNRGPLIAGFLILGLLVQGCGLGTENVVRASALQPSSSPIGRGWSRVDLPKPPGWAGGYAWSAIACSSRDECLVGGAEGPNQNSIMESTANGGQTWSSRTRFPPSMDGGIESSACDQQGCFIAAENRAVNSQIIGRTSDLGKTWSVVPNPPMWGRNSVTANLVACSATRCIFYGSNIFAIPLGKLASLRDGFAATSNNGHTWREIGFPGAITVDQMTCIWSGQCWALYETRTDALVHVATTTDGGSAWTAFGPIRPSEVGGDTYVLDPDHMSGFACEDARTCFIIDDSDDLLMSSDGGRTWAKSLAPRDANGVVDFSTEALTCTPSSTCWIITNQSAWVGPPGP
jgi:hypothetical protein